MTTSITKSSAPTRLFSSDYEAHVGIVPSGAEIFFLRRKGSNASLPPLVLLHGFPQNHSLWHKFVKHLPSDFDVLIPDLPGYGMSKKELSEAGFSKRAMADDILALADQIYGANTKIIAYGHDRGARVAYRMALDHADRIKGLAVLDIVPGIEQFGVMRLDKDRHRETLTSYHWLFLAQPAPLPETIIAAAPEYYITECINRWSGPRFRGKYEQAEMDAWVQPYVRSKAVIAGSCEDYRAAARIDLEHEEQEPTRVTVPTLILYSHSLTRHPVKEMWEKHLAPSSKATFAQTGDEQGGHFNPVEAVDDVVKETRNWLKDSLGISVW